MPKDAWKPLKTKAAVRRANTGEPMPSPKWKKRKRKGAKKSKGAVRSETKDRILKQRLQSPNTTIWFGKYKGRKIEDIPLDYLRWVAENCDRSSKRMNVLCQFIDKFIAERRVRKLTPVHSAI